MKSLPLFILLVSGLIAGAMVLAACDRSMDDINPDPIAPGVYGPGSAYPSLMRTTGAPPIPEEQTDTTSGRDEDTTSNEDVAAVDTEAEVNACIGSEEFCSCLAEKGNDPKYTDYCNCMTAASVPGGDFTIYCGCCTFAFDDSFAEHDGSEGTEEAWFYQQQMCLGLQYTSPCVY